MWLTETPATVPPSPKSQAKDRTSPSGSVESAPFMLTGAPTTPCGGAVMTAVGARFTSITVIRVVAVTVLQPALSLAWNVTVYIGPASNALKSGVHENVPVIIRWSWKVAPSGRPVALNVTRSPSGSVADTVNVRLTPSGSDSPAGAVSTGHRSALLTVMAVVAEPESAFEAVKVTL